MRKIKIGKTTYTDSMGKIHQKDNSILCCGKNIRMISHIDGDDFFIFDYLCECGNIISCYSTRTLESEFND